MNENVVGDLIFLGSLSYMGNGTSGKISFGLVLASEDCSSLQA